MITWTCRCGRSWPITEAQCSSCQQTPLDVPEIMDAVCAGLARDMESADPGLDLDELLSRPIQALWLSSSDQNGKEIITVTPPSAAGGCHIKSIIDGPEFYVVQYHDGAACVIPEEHVVGVYYKARAGSEVGDE